MDTHEEQKQLRICQECQDYLNNGPLYKEDGTPEIRTVGLKGSPVSKCIHLRDNEE